MFRRKTYPRSAGLIALLALLVGAGPGQAAPFLAVPTAGEPGQIEVVDSATDTVVGKFGVFEDAHGSGVTPDGRFLLVACLAEREAGETIGKPAGVSSEDHSAHLGGGAASGATGLSIVSVIDLALGNVIRQIDVPGAVHHVAISENGKFAAFTHPAAGTMSIVRLQDFALITSVPVGDDPNYAVFTPDSAHLFVSVASDDQLVFIDVAGWQIKARLDTGAGPEHLVLTPDGDKLLVNLIGEEAIGLVDTELRVVERIYQIDAFLHGIDVTDDGGAAIVSLMDQDKVARLDLADGSIETRDVGPSPYHVTTVPGSGKVYVSSAAGPGLTVLSQHDLSVLGQIKTGGIGHQMAPLPKQVKDLGVNQ